MILILLINTICIIAGDGVFDHLAVKETKGFGADRLEHGTIDLLNRRERSSDSELVDIARFIDKSHAGKAYTVLVDDTMERLIFQVTTEESDPQINVTIPSGTTYLIQPMLHTNNNKTTARMDIPLNTSDYGEWTFSKYDDYTWNVTVQAESAVYITHQLYEIGSNITLDESPIANSKYRLVVMVSGMSEVQSIDSVFMISKTRINLQKLITFNVSDNNTLEAETTSILFETFYVGIKGQDNSNHEFQRIDPRFVEPVKVGIDVPSYEGVQLSENTKLTINFTVTVYHVSARHVEVKIEGSGNFVQEPKAVNFTIMQAGKNDTGGFVLITGAPGTSTTVRISTKFSMGRGELTDGPEVVRTFTVRNEDSGTPVGAIVGGLCGSIAVIGAVVGSVIGYRNFIVPRLKVKHDSDKDVKDGEHIVKTTPVQT